MLFLTADDLSGDGRTGGVHSSSQEGFDPRAAAARRVGMDVQMSHLLYDLHFLIESIELLMISSWRSHCSLLTFPPD